MKFQLFIDCNNAAFWNDSDDVSAESASIEISRILRDVAQQIENGAPYAWFQTIRDINGNDVGRYAIKPDDYK